MFIFVIGNLTPNQTLVTSGQDSVGIIISIVTPQKIWKIRSVVLSVVISFHPSIICNIHKLLQSESNHDHSTFFYLCGCVASLLQ